MVDDFILLLNVLAFSRGNCVFAVFHSVCPLQMKNVRAYVGQAFLLAITSFKNTFMIVVGLVFAHG